MLEGGSHGFRSVAFSHDSARLASVFYNRIVKIWDASNGACTQTLEGHSGLVGSMAFSYDSARLASASDDNTVKICDASNGAYLQMLEGHSWWPSSVDHVSILAFTTSRQNCKNPQPNCPSENSD